MITEISKTAPRTIRSIPFDALPSSLYDISSAVPLPFIATALSFESSLESIFLHFPKN